MSPSASPHSGRAGIRHSLTAEPDGTEVSWALKDVSRFERSVTETLAGMFDCTLPIVIANGSPTDRFNPTSPNDLSLRRILRFRRRPLWAPRA
jgi:hypothetical protein